MKNKIGDRKRNWHNSSFRRKKLPKRLRRRRRRRRRRRGRYLMGAGHALQLCMDPVDAVAAV
jgi:hypothetical protein